MTMSGEAVGDAQGPVEPVRVWGRRGKAGLLKRVVSEVSLFFFQAEDGIRDYKVTGVQTCALPICPRPLPDISIVRKRASGAMSRGGPKKKIREAKDGNNEGIFHQGVEATVKLNGDRKSVV